MTANKSIRDRVEDACEVMHDAYERAAVGAGWDTNPASRKPWADVPESNRVTMRAAVGALLDHLAAAGLLAEVAEIPEHDHRWIDETILTDRERHEQCLASGCGATRSLPR